MNLSTNFKNWIRNILLLGQKDLYTSFAKTYLFFLTHLFLLVAVYKLVQWIANLQGYDINLPYVKISVPTALSWYLYFEVGKKLPEREISVLTLIYGYITFIILIFFNFKSIVDFAFGKNVYKK